MNELRRPPVLGYDVHGPADAPVVVLGSSLGTTRTMWDEQLPALSERYRVVRYDHRGHGRSPVPPAPYTVDDLGADLVALLDELGIVRAHHVGLSLGGIVAMWLAAHHPARVDRLALVCTGAHLP
ncbi:MAG: alpha/beta fold hydrolase, partial [Jiangellaceae bacterium]